MRANQKRKKNKSSVISKNTILWIFGVLVGAVLVSLTFFLEPLNNDYFAESRNVKASEKDVQAPETYNINTNLSDQVTNVEINVSCMEPKHETVEDQGNKVSMEEYDALCRIVTAEANTEDIKGQILVANVILNRVASPKFPNSIQEVILSPGQFEPVTRGYFDYCEPSDLSKEAVMRALNGEDYSQGALYFQVSEATEWGDHQYLFRCGNHSFYK